MKAFELMSKPLIWAHLHDPIQKVAMLLEKRHISGVPVRGESGQPVGVFTRSDLAFYDHQRLERLLGLAGTAGQKESFLEPKQEKIEAWINPRIYSVREDATLLGVIREMLRRKVHRLLVRSKATGEMMGVVTVRDILGYIAKRRYV